MSLIGIDVGSSSVKVAAYSEDGQLLSIIRNDLKPRHGQPGWWEQDPDEVWRTTAQGLRRVIQAAPVHRDSPTAVAISASGRENFPADLLGNPLGPTLMGADIRGAEFERTVEGKATLEPWELSCGHRRERMDPVFRLLWWRKYHSDVMEKAKLYPDWHGFLTLRLCGRNVTERSLAGRWMTYDLERKDWSWERLAEYGIDAALLPELLPCGMVIGEIRPKVAEELGVSTKLKIVVGGHDLNCAAIGSGSSSLGSACLVSGSYENLVIPTMKLPSKEMLLRGLSVTPHLGRIPLSVYAICPTGNAVLNWARDLFHLSIEEQAEKLRSVDREPSPVLAIPYLSGAMLYWKDGRKLRGALLGLTLASSEIDILKAFMESIAYDHVNTFSVLQESEIQIDRIRAMGGGSRSVWWTQLKADMLQVPIEVVAQPEPGTLGAAILAGVGAGVFCNLEEASESLSGTVQVYYPESTRRKLHDDKLDLYRRAVENLQLLAFDPGHHASN